MNKKTLFLAGLMTAGILSAQNEKGRVGINTDTPKATLDIRYISEDKAKGVMVPRITPAEMKAMTPELNADQNSMVTYLINELPLTDRTGSFERVSRKGYYYWEWDNVGNKGVWLPISEIADLRMVGQNNHITQDAGIGGFGNSVGTGKYNIAIGEKTLAKNTTGENNVAIGQYILVDNTAGYNNIGIGKSVLQFNKTGNNNIAIGYPALNDNTTGNQNIAIQGLSNNTTGNGNIAISGLPFNTTGSYNIAIGNGSMGNNISGEYNTAIGTHNVGSWIKGKYNTQIGTGWGNISITNHTSELDNVVAIGNGFSDLSTTTGQDHVLLLGESDELHIPFYNKINIGAGTYKPQVKLDVAGEIRVRSTNSTCTNNIEGAIRYNKTTKKFQGCDGTAWVNLN